MQFDYDEQLVDDQGVYKGTVTKHMRIPLLAAISHPNITIEEGNIDFELTYQVSKPKAPSKPAAKRLCRVDGLGAVQCRSRGRPVTRRLQTRKTDTRAVCHQHPGGASGPARSADAGDRLPHRCRHQAHRDAKRDRAASDALPTAGVLPAPGAPVAHTQA